MPRSSKLLKLPQDLLTELNDRIRANGYSGYADLSAWLRGKGHVVGRSAVHAYGQSLREVDAGAGDVAAIVSRAGVGQPCRNQRAEAIVAELGRLRVREHQLLQELAELEQPLREPQ
ncbi:DUF3486 family protein [Lysobacter maris]|uniref:DUF3486 family protein n=1 Tax=Marilutibacter maris TaxID=1605891 RepID=A0A508ABV0_9GAMM|nr:DUF3486 family protein [Lysobacter maris]